MAVASPCTGAMVALGEGLSGGEAVSSHDVRRDVSLGFATRVAETHVLTHICRSRSRISGLSSRDRPSHCTWVVVLYYCPFQNL
jgi:hypothetical protein